MCQQTCPSSSNIFFSFQHFLDYVNKDYVEDLGMIPLEYLQAEDMRLVVIGPAPFKFIAVSKNTFKHKLYKIK